MLANQHMKPAHFKNRLRDASLVFAKSRSGLVAAPRLIDAPAGSGSSPSLSL